MRDDRKPNPALREEAAPTAKEFARRREFLELARRLRATPPPAAGRSPTVEELLRKDRSR